MYRLLGVVHMNPEISTDQWDHSEVRCDVSCILFQCINADSCCFLFAICRRKSMDLEEYVRLSCSTILLELMWFIRRQSSTFVALLKLGKCIMNSRNSSDLMEWVLTTARSLSGLKIHGRSNISFVTDWT